MDEIKNLSEDEFNLVAAENQFNRLMLIKDYCLTILLYYIKDVNGIYFKGGTALQKTILNHSRLSEDLDFTCTKPIDSILKEINSNLKNKKLFTQTEYDKSVKDFTRLIVNYSVFGIKGKINIDLNKRAKLLEKPQKMKINSFYPNLKTFEVKTLSLNELIAEKVTATIARNKPRDHYDLYKIIQNGYKIDFKLVKKKCIQTGTQFDIEKIFSKASKLYSRWNKDMNVLLKEKVDFKKILQNLAKEFKLKKIKKQKKIKKEKLNF